MQVASCLPLLGNVVFEPCLWKPARRAQLFPCLHGSPDPQGGFSLPSPPWLLCQAGQQHRMGKLRVLATGLVSLHLSDMVRQENTERALEMTAKQGVHVQLIHRVE